MVRINELITGVNVLLGSAAISACPAIDYPQPLPGVYIHCAVVAVNAALNGCLVNSPTPTEPCADAPEHQPCTGPCGPPECVIVAQGYCRNGRCVTDCAPCVTSTPDRESPTPTPPPFPTNTCYTPAPPVPDRTCNPLACDDAPYGSCVEFGYTGTCRHYTGAQSGCFCYIESSTHTATPMPCTPTPTPRIIGDLGYVGVRGVVFDAAHAESAPIAGATVHYAHSSLVRPGSMDDVTTTADGRFKICLYLHDTDTITLTADAPDFVPAARHFGGYFLYANQRPIEIGLMPLSGSSE